MYGYIIVVVGVFLWTIGGFIRMFKYPHLDNIEARRRLDPKRPLESEYPTEEEVIYSYFQDPKIMWWCWSGFGFFVLGLFLTLIGV